MNLVNDLKQEKRKVQESHDGKPIAVVSIAYGLFIIVYEGYFSGLLLPHVSKVPENIIGTIFILVGIFKLIGILKNNSTMKRIGIYLLAISWGGLLGVSLMYSLGIGYPNPMPLFCAKFVWDCWRIAARGVF